MIFGLIKEVNYGKFLVLEGIHPQITVMTNRLILQNVQP
jgi:hypothetical protein